MGRSKYDRTTRVKMETKPDIESSNVERAERLVLFLDKITYHKSGYICYECDANVIVLMTAISFF